MTTLENKQWLDVCSKDDLIADSGVTALLNGKQIAIFYLPQNDRLYAIDNHCPFSEANIISRGIIGDLKGKIVVASPIYKQHFCLESGTCLEDDSVTLEVFDIKIENDQVQIAF